MPDTPKRARGACPQPLTPDQRVPRRALTVRTRNYRGRLVVAVGSREPLVLSQTAAFVYRAVDGCRTAREIARLTAAEYGVPPRAALEDVGRFLDQLADVGVVEF